MKEFKGTPGKWDVGMDGEILSDAGYIVMSTVLVHGNDSDRDLIAAAPELLSALQGMLEINSLNDAGKLSRFKAANAAIAKALGDQNETD